LLVAVYEIGQIAGKGVKTFVRGRARADRMRRASLRHAKHGNVRTVRVHDPRQRGGVLPVVLNF
jgi:hypothetical protein